MHASEFKQLVHVRRQPEGGRRRRRPVEAHPEARRDRLARHHEGSPPAVLFADGVGEVLRQPPDAADCCRWGAGHSAVVPEARDGGRNATHLARLRIAALGLVGEECDQAESSPKAWHHKELRLAGGEVSEAPDESGRSLGVILLHQELEGRPPRLRERVESAVAAWGFCRVGCTRARGHAWALASIHESNEALSRTLASAWALRSASQASATDRIGRSERASGTEFFKPCDFFNCLF